MDKKSVILWHLDTLGFLGIQKFQNIILFLN